MGNQDSLFAIKSQIAYYYLRRSMPEAMLDQLTEQEKELSDTSLNPLSKAYWHLLKAYYLNAFSDQPKNAINHLNQAREHSLKTDNQYLQGLIDHELANRQISWPVARRLLMYERALTHFKNTGHYDDAIASIINIGTMYTQKGQIDRSNEVFNHLMSLSENHIPWHHLEKLYQQVSDNYKIQQDSLLYIQYKGLALEARININQLRYWQESEDLSAIYEKEVAIEAFNNEKIISQKIEERASLNQKNYSIILTASFFVALLGLYNYLLHKKVKKINFEIQMNHGILNGIHQQLSSELKKKNLIHKELNQRVKKNLDFLIKIVRLEQHSSHTSQEKSLFQSLNQRIQSIALVHEKLQKQINNEQIDFDDYLKKLAIEISKSIGFEEKVALHLTGRYESFSMEEVVPLAMIINELITNSYKHAFTDQQAPAIFINMATEEGYHLLEYTDNGHGQITTDKNSLGMRLVKLLAEQLDGSVDYQKHQKAIKVKIVWPIHKD
jgi:two-component sensor histidine kinase